MSRAPPDLTVREAVERWLDKLRVQRTEASVSTYWYRLKLFVEWTETQGIERVSELSGWTIESYETHRRAKNPTAVSLNNEFQTLKLWLEYCARIGLVGDDLPDRVEVPDVPEGQESSDVRLAPEDALELLDWYRAAPEAFGTRDHVLLELAWHTGARAGGLVALDLQDLQESDGGTRYLSFVNRPESGTRLKKGGDGERPVLLPEPIWNALDRYVAQHRIDKHDDQGRQPLLASQNGRPTPGTIRDWMYVATQPCLHSPCPHGKERATCEWVALARASKCPSSRSPHQVRTGAITWMRNRGVPAEVVAERVNARVETIEQHYDKEEAVTEMLKRRAEHLRDLDIQAENGHETDP